MKKVSSQFLSRLFIVITFLFLFFDTPCFAALIRRTITYPSSVSVNADGPLDLQAELNYDSMRTHAPIAVVMHGYSPTSTFSEFRPAAERLRNKGFFTILAAMRGRDGSEGIRDSGGVEIFDIYDAVEAVKSRYSQYVNPEIIYITGYSGGGGNAMSALTKFPDYFRAGTGFFGMSDYGCDAVNGWYFNGASSSHRAILNTDIGNPTLGDPLVLDRYMARASNLASKNNPYSEIHLFVNYNEAVCPPINIVSYRDHAVSASRYPDEFSNIHIHIGGYGEYVDFNNNGIHEADELQNWPHQLPTADQQAAAENWFLGRLLSGQIPQPVMNAADTLFVAGYVKTRPFFVWLGDGQNAAAELRYSLSASEKTFDMDILSSDQSITGRIAINVEDMAGQTVQVLVNGSAVEHFTATDSYVYHNLRHGDRLVLRTGSIEKSADLNQDSEVDFFDLAILAGQWQLTQGDLSSDLNSDGIVDEQDLLMLSENWFKGKPVQLYFAGMDSDPEWSREGQWQFGQPAGGGGELHGHADPESGKTGSCVFGVNLQGDYDVRVGGPYRLTLGPLDCRGFKQLSVEFARWLNTDEPYYVDSRIEYSVNGTDWTVLWRHEGNAFIADSDWTRVNYHLGGAADDQPTVYIRWSYGILNPRVWPYSGWNIDDVAVWAKPIEE